MERNGTLESCTSRAGRLCCCFKIGPPYILLFSFCLQLFTEVDNVPLLVLCHLQAINAGDGHSFIDTLLNIIITRTGHVSQKIAVGIRRL